MYSSGQYRAKAIEYGNLVRTSASDSEKREYRKLEQKFAELADNEEWLAEHRQQTLHGAGTEQSGDAFLMKEASIPHNERLGGVGLAQEDERILRCLGAALIMEWGTLPRKLQRELFDNAGTMGGLLDTASFRGKIARFLHLNNSGLQ